MVEIHPRIDRHLYIEDGDLARPYREAIRRGRALAVQQGVHDDRTGIRCRFFDPERLEKGKLLALGFAGVDRKAPSREPVLLPLCDRAEVACAEEDANFVIIIRLVDRGVKPKAREAEINARIGRWRVAERKLLGLISDLGRLAVG